MEIEQFASAVSVALGESLLTIVPIRGIIYTIAIRLARLSQFLTRAPEGV